MIDNDTTLHRLRFSGPATSLSEKVWEFLNTELRAEAGFTVQQEYPSLFGDYPGGQSLFMEREGKIVSHAGILVREFQAPSVRMKIGLLGSVITDFRYRGEGMASQLIKEAVQTFKQSRCALAMLWSDKAEFYSALGFFRAGREVDMRFSKASVGDQPGKAREGIKESEVNQLWRLYHRHPYRLDRSLEEMKKLVKIPKTRVFVTEKAGEITSYLVVGKGADFKDYIHEWAGDQASLVEAIAHIQRNVFPDSELTLISPAGSELRKVSAISQSKWDGVLGLVKIIDRSLLLSIYTDFLLHNDIRPEWNSEKTHVVIQKKSYSVVTDQECLKLVLGTEVEAEHPVLPLFLWGFDSI